MNNTEPQDIAALLGQATPRPWKVDRTGSHIGIKGSNGKFAFRKVVSSLTIDQYASLERDLILIVLAVNALPAFLKLREAVLTNSVNRPFAIDGALSEVDAALGLSKEPSSTPVDATRKEKIL